MSKRALLVGVLLSAAVMIALPVGIFGFATGDSGMALALGFMYIVTPAWSILAGVYAGRDMAHLWPLPLISAGLFLPGMCIGTASFSTDFLLYTAVYAAVGAGAMLISWFAAKPSESAG